jgi:hypothetical protein
MVLMMASREEFGLALRLIDIDAKGYDLLQRISSFFIEENDVTKPKTYIRGRESRADEIWEHFEIWRGAKSSASWTDQTGQY